MAVVRFLSDLVGNPEHNEAHMTALQATNTPNKTIFKGAEGEMNISCVLDVYSAEDSTGLRPIYVMFFKFLLISFQMKNNDNMWL